MDLLGTQAIIGRIIEVRSTFHMDAMGLLFGPLFGDTQIECATIIPFRPDLKSRLFLQLQTAQTLHPKRFLSSVMRTAMCHMECMTVWGYRHPDRLVTSAFAPHH